MDVTGNVQFVISSQATKALDLSTPSDTISFQTKYSFTDGTGANKANQHWSDTRTLADGASEELDLAGGLTDAFGDTVTFTKIKTLYIRNNSADANLIIGGAAANGFTAMFGGTDDTLILPAGAAVMLCASSHATGYAVTADTGDLLQIEHDGTGDDSLTYDIVIIGEVA